MSVFAAVMASRSVQMLGLPEVSSLLLTVMVFAGATGMVLGIRAKANKKAAQIVRTMYPQRLARMRFIARPLQAGSLQLSA